MAITGQQIRVTGDGRTALLDVAEQPVIDEPKFPEEGPTSDAVESFRIVWTPTGPLQTFEDKSKYFLIKGYPAVARAQFAVTIPELNFSFQGTATSTIAILGDEVNGHYYLAGEEPPAQAFPQVGMLGTPAR